MPIDRDEDENDVASAARGGDRAAFAALFEAYRPMLAALCWRALGDPHLVEDAVQEAALRALLSLQRLRQPGQFGAWLGGIALNVCRDWLRRRPREAWSWESLVGGYRAPEPLTEAPDPAELVVDEEIATRVRSAIADLPPGQRAAVALFYLSGFSLAETAAHLEISPGAVKTRLYKARAGLRLSLADFQEDIVTDTTTIAEPVDVRVVEVQRIRRGEGDGALVQGHVVLQEIRGTRSLTVWIGEWETTAMALRLEGVELPRPGPYALTGSLLRSIGGEIREATIERLVGDVFYATVRVEGPGGAATIDARPSDAINLALLAGAPIRVAREVLVAAGAEGLPAPPGVVERGPEIATRVVQEWRTRF